MKQRCGQGKKLGLDMVYAIMKEMFKELRPKPLVNASKSMMTSRSLTESSAVQILMIGPLLMIMKLKMA